MSRGGGKIVMSGNILNISKHEGTNIITYMVRCITYQLTAAEGVYNTRTPLPGDVVFIGLERVGQEGLL